MRTSVLACAAVVLSVLGCEPTSVTVHTQTLTVIPNLDDDDRDGRRDWEQVHRPDTDRDIATTRTVFAGLRVMGRLEGVRIYVDGDPVAGVERGRTWSTRAGADRQLGIELSGWDPDGWKIELLDAAGRVVERVQVASEGAAVGHALLPTEHVWVVRSNQSHHGNNRNLLTALSRNAGDRLFVIDAKQVDGDLWLQDEVEFARTPSGATVHIDSPRDPPWGGGLGKIVPTMMGPNRIVVPFGDPRRSTSFDGLGNLEASPPVTVDGVEYPFGRVLIGGRTDGEKPQEGLMSILNAFGTQAPVLVDTTWLCVGHIDELLAFVPDGAAPRGFRMLIASPQAGLEVLDTMPSSQRLMHHERRGPRGHDRATVASYAEDFAFRSYNEDLQIEHVDPVLAHLSRVLALRPEEVVHVPVLFDEIVSMNGACGAGAVTPNPLNHLLITHAGGQGGTAILADPMMRAADDPQSSDAFLRAWREVIPRSVQMDVVDLWDVYHVGAGEAHCATNQIRVPPQPAVR